MAINKRGLKMELLQQNVKKVFGNLFFLLKTKIKFRKKKMIIILFLFQILLLSRLFYYILFRHPFFPFKSFFKYFCTTKVVINCGSTYVSKYESHLFSSLISKSKSKACNFVSHRRGHRSLLALYYKIICVKGQCALISIFFSNEVL